MHRSKHPKKTKLSKLKHPAVASLSLWMQAKRKPRRIVFSTMYRGFSLVWVWQKRYPVLKVKNQRCREFLLFSFSVGQCSIHSRYFALVIVLALNFSFWLYHSFNNFSTSSKLSKSRIVSIGTLPPQPCSQSYQINVRIMSSGVSALVKKFSSWTFNALAMF